MEKLSRMHEQLLSHARLSISSAEEPRITQADMMHGREKRAQDMRAQDMHARDVRARDVHLRHVMHGRHEQRRPIHEQHVQRLFACVDDSLNAPLAPPADTLAPFSPGPAVGLLPVAAEPAENPRGKCPIHPISPRCHTPREPSRQVSYTHSTQMTRILTRMAHATFSLSMSPSPFSRRALREWWGLCLRELLLRPRVIRLTARRHDRPPKLVVAGLILSGAQSTHLGTMRLHQHLRPERRSTSGDSDY